MKIVGDKIVGRSLFNGCHFAKRELCLKLIGNSFGNFALNREYVCEVTVVGLCPKVRVCPGINQLDVYPHFPTIPLDAAFK
jgi:hypothetical protein